MKGTAALLVSAFLLTLATSAGAVPGGELDTLEKGRYVCETAGEDAGPIRIHVPSADFTVISASSYHVDGKRGSYLLTGDSLTMTSGPFKGKRFHRQSRGFLREVDKAGMTTALRCVRAPHSAY